MEFIKKKPNEENLAAVIICGHALTSSKVNVGMFNLSAAQLGQQTVEFCFVGLNALYPVNQRLRVNNRLYCAFTIKRTLRVSLTLLIGDW